MNIVTLVLLIISFVFVCLTNSRVKKIYKMLNEQKKEEQKKKIRLNRPYFFILTLILLLLLKLLFICTLFRSPGVSISSNLSDVQSKSTHSFFYYIHTRFTRSLFIIRVCLPSYTYFFC